MNEATGGDLELKHVITHKLSFTHTGAHTRTLTPKHTFRPGIVGAVAVSTGLVGIIQAL